MTPKNIRLGAGEMYFNTPDGFVPLGDVQEVELTEEPELDILGNQPRIIVPPTREFTATVTLTEEASEALRKLMAPLEEAVAAFKRIWETIKALPLPSRRVVHLATRHGSPRVRKKNHRRIERYYIKLTKGRGSDERNPL
jgi:hypothetical protein